MTWTDCLWKVFFCR